MTAWPRPRATALAGGVLLLVVVTMAGAGAAGATGRAAAGGTAARTSASAVAGRAALGDELPAAPRGARLQGAVPVGQDVALDVVLRFPDPGAVAAEVAAVSDPGSPQYRQFLTPAQFRQRFAPAATTVAGVRRWLAAAGLSVEATGPDGYVVPVHGPAGAVEAAFGTRLESVELASGKPAHLNTTVPNVPAALGSAVRSVVGLDDAVSLTPQLRRSSTPLSAHVSTPAATGGPTVGPQPCAQVADHTGAGGPYSMADLAQAYDFTGLFSQDRTGAGQTIGVYELEQFDPTDIAAFESCYGLDVPISTNVIDGGPGGPLVGTGEAALDIEDAASFAPGASLVVYEGPNGGTGPLDVYQTIADQDVTRQVTTSWGVCEAQNLPAGTADAEAQIFSQMAAQGQDLVAAAGDTGSEDCLPQSNGLAVDDPGSQQNVVSAGGTTLPKPDTNAGESVWNNCAEGGGATSCNQGGAGGGGISSVWGMPAWQQVVAGSASSGAPCHADAGYCREEPDVSADADPFHSGVVIYWNGNWVITGGTSAVAPLWAALLTDVDQGCAAPTGFADPALYRLGAAGSTALHDITSGNNDLTGTHGGLYPAAHGYDMASGWGSPQGGALAAALQPAGGCPVVSGLSASTVPLGQSIVLDITGVSLAGATAVNFGPLGPGQILADSPTSITVRTPLDRGAPELVNVTVTTPAGTSATVAAGHFVFGTVRQGSGYWEVAADGGIFSYGGAPFFGSMGGRPLDRPIVGLAVTSDGDGYWEVASDGGIFAFGDAGFFGSMGARPLNRPIVGLAAQWDGLGYWEVATDGGVFSFGDARFHGSAATLPLVKPVVGMTPSFSGGGYTQVSADGGVFTYGDAGFYGSLGGLTLNRPVVGIASTNDGLGYWEVATDGGIFSFGDAAFAGSAGSLVLHAPVVGMGVA